MEILNNSFLYSDINSLKKGDGIVGWINGYLNPDEIINIEYKPYNQTYLVYLENDSTIDIPGDWKLVLKEKTEYDVCSIDEDIEKVKYKEALIVPDCKLNDDVKDDNYKLGYLKGGIAVCNNYRTKHDFLVVEHLAVHHEGAEAYKSFLFDVFDCEIDQPLVKNDKYKKSIYIRSKGYYKTTIEDPTIIEKLLSPLTPEEYNGFLASCYDIIGASNGSEIKFTFKDKTLIDRIFEMLTHFGFSSKVRFLNKFKAYGDKFIIYDVVIQGGINEIVKFLRLCPIYNTKKRTKVLKVKRLDPPSKIIKIEEIKHDSPIMYPQIKTKYGFFNAGGIIFKD